MDDYFLVIKMKQEFPGTLKDTRFDPVFVDAVNRRCRCILASSKSLPLAAGSKNINNSIKSKTKGSGIAARGTRLFFRRKKRSNKTPQIVRDMPNCIQRGLGRQSYPPVMESPKKVYVIKTSKSFFV